MRHLWIAACLAGCSSSPTPETPTNVPDHFDQNLDVIVRSVTHPCGAEEDTDGDGVADTHWKYTYDSHGRSKQDLARDDSNAIAHQIDYTWDNGGNLVDYKESLPILGMNLETIGAFDSLGRTSQYVFLTSDGTTLQRRMTYNYDAYDDFGHPTHASELIEDVAKNMTRTADRVYAYDDLGRRMSLVVHFGTGELYQNWHHVYDDVARTVTSHLDEPITLSGQTGVSLDGVETYNADFHLIGSHDVSTPLDGSEAFVTDMVADWQGERQLQQTTTQMGQGISITTSLTYKYSCN